MCVHELVLQEPFQKNYFHIRWHRRSNLTVNKNKGNYVNPFCSSGVSLQGLGITEEDTSSFINEDNMGESIDMACNPCIVEENGIPIDNINNELVNKTLENSFENNSLDYTSMHSITSQLYNACKRNKEKNVLVGGFLIQLLNAVNNTDSDNVLSQETLPDQLLKLVRNYNNSFTSVNEMTNISKNNIDMPVAPKNHHKAPNKRIKSSLEQSKTNVIGVSKNNLDKSIKVKINKRREFSCKFCGQAKHRITNCMVRQTIVGEPVNGDELIEYVTHHCPFRIATENDEKSLIENMIWSNVRHYKLHQIISTINPNNLRPATQFLLVKLTCYDKIGQEINGYNPCCLRLQTLIAELHRIKNMKFRFIFSSISEESIGVEYMQISSINYYMFNQSMIMPMSL